MGFSIISFAFLKFNKKITLSHTTVINKFMSIITLTTDFGLKDHFVGIERKDFEYAE
jgi:hypothetical protein